MPKRIGFVYEQVISLDNCILAVQEMARSKPKVRRAQYMKENAEYFGKKLHEQLSSGTWEPRPYHEKTIGDGIEKKQRHIKVPCLWDQCVHHALMQITAPYIQRRNYFYNCGSIPGAGQIRITRAIKRWMAKKKMVKYGASLDVYHFFESCKTEIVMKALSRIFKDKKFLALHRKVLDSMGGSLAIGFCPSHWYGNLVLSYIDNLIKQRLLPRADYGRYMDDMVILFNDKRKMHKAIRIISNVLKKLGLCLKKTWQVFKIAGRGIQFLSYRFFHGYTLLTKKLMYRISRRIKSQTKCKSPSPHAAASIISYMGILKHCNSYNYMKDRVYPYVNIRKCKGVIRNEARRIHKLTTEVRDLRAA